MQSVYSPSDFEKDFLLEVLVIDEDKQNPKKITYERIREIKPVAGGEKEGFLIYGASYSPHLLLAEKSNGLIDRLKLLRKSMRLEDITIVVEDRGIGREVTAIRPEKVF